MVPYNILSCRMILRIISLTMFFFISFSITNCHPRYPVLHMDLSYITPAHPIRSYRIPSHPITYHPIPSHFILSCFRLHPIVCYLILSQDLQWYALTLWPKNHLPARQPEPSKHAFSGISCHVISYNIISYHIMPYHIDRIIPYHIV